MNELEVSEDQVRKEHLASVNAPAHWAYLLGILGVGLALMLIFIAVLDAA